MPIETQSPDAGGAMTSSMRRWRPFFNIDPEMEESNANSTKNRKPIFTILALVLAIAEFTISLILFSSGKGAGFEGFGAMLLGTAIALIAIGPVLILLLVAILRKESMIQMRWIAFSVSMLGLLTIIVS